MQLLAAGKELQQQTAFCGREAGTEAEGDC
jgi:hypothetical protein